MVRVQASNMASLGFPWIIPLRMVDPFHWIIPEDRVRVYGQSTSYPQVWGGKHPGAAPTSARVIIKFTLWMIAINYKAIRL